jgi:hypothetical protein
MLHGRHSFHVPANKEDADGARHLRGGYVNIDEFANTYNLIRRAHGGGGRRASLGNQDWGDETTPLPPE